MLKHIQLLRNVGAFDSITPGAAVPFDLFNLVYAENGRGKTTLAERLAANGGHAHISSDLMRRSRAGIAPGEPAPPDLYTREAREDTLFATLTFKSGVGGIPS